MLFIVQLELQKTKTSLYHPPNTPHQPLINMLACSRQCRGLELCIKHWNETTKQLYQEDKSNQAIDLLRPRLKIDTFRLC